MDIDMIQTYVESIQVAQDDNAVKLGIKLSL